MPSSKGPMRPDRKSGPPRRPRPKKAPRSKPAPPAQRVPRQSGPARRERKARNASDKATLSSLRPRATQKLIPWARNRVACVREAVETAYFPQLPHRCVLPSKVLPQGASLTASRQTVGYNFDIATAAAVIASQASAYVPSIADQTAGTSTPLLVWPLGNDLNYTFVHTSDPMCPLIHPVVSSLTNPAAGNVWQYPITQSAWAPEFHQADNRPAFDNIQPLALSYGTCATMPAGFTVRPISGVRDPNFTDTNRYLWVDSASNQSSIITVSVAASFGAVNIATNYALTVFVHQRLALSEILLGDRYEAFVPVANSTVAINPVNFTVRSSGWYRVSACVTTTTQTSYYSLESLSGTVSVTEYTKVCTGFVLNTSLQVANGFGSGYYPMGSAVLFSLRGPRLTIEGSILAARTQPAVRFNFYDATSVGTAIFNDTPVDGVSTYHGDGGGQLSKGLYSISHPSVRPNRPCPIFEAGSQDPFGYASGVPPVYLVGTTNAFGTFNVVLMSYSAGPTNVPLRICYDVASAIVLRNQAVAPSPYHIMSVYEEDEYNKSVRVMPVFTENPWHLALLSAIPRIVAAVDLAQRGFHVASKWAGNARAILSKLPETAAFISGMDWSVDNAS